MAWLRSLDVQAVWHGATVLVLVWLGLFFGRTLVRGRIPLIEQIARVGDPQLNPSLVRYTRSLTWVWCVYFFAGALLAVFMYATPFPVGLAVGLGSAVLFVGEHRWRRRHFPGESFPGLLQQVRDTWAVWHPAKRAHD